MKKYVFLAPSIANMGGAQMYICNKVLYLKDKGWKTDVITEGDGVPAIEELKQFKNSVPEIAFDSYCYSRRRRKKVVSQLSQLITNKEYEEIVIESTCIQECTWAELVAKEIGAKNFCFLLQEDNYVTNSGMQQFFFFKHKRRELVGIADTSLLDMFKTFHPLAKEESYRLPAYCNNVEADVEHPLINVVRNDNSDFVVGTLSRLDKPFVMPAIKDFCQYANKHKEKNFLYLLMGGAPEGSSIPNDIQAYISSNAENVELLMIGYLYPVPTKLLELCDVFFTSAGSGWVCARSGVPTIAIDGKDYKPIGILGRTTQSALFRGNNDPQIEFDELMDEILIQRKYKKEEPNYKSGLPDFQSHMDFLASSSAEKEYYDMDSIKIEDTSDRILKLALAIIGPNMYQRLGAIKANLLKK